MSSIGITNKSTIIGTAPVVIAEQLDPGQRKSINVANTSADGQIVYVSSGSEAVVGAGFVLYPGGNLSSTANGSYNPPNLRWTAISNEADATIAISEEIEVRR